LRYKTHGVSFLSYPVLDSLLGVIFDTLEYKANAPYITNVHNVKGWFTNQEPQTSNNYAVPWISLGLVDELSVNVSALKRVKLTSTIRDSVYRSFCTLEEMCGRERQFAQYCGDLIGEADLLYLRAALQEFH
jgi:hypothetical protein